MSRVDDLIEANKRGLLKGQVKQDFDQAVTRGIIKVPAGQATDEQLSDVTVPKGKLTNEQIRRLQSTLVTPGAKTSLGAVGRGFMRGAESVGEGLIQRGLDVGEFLGFDTAETRGKLQESRKIQQQKFKPTKEEFPISSTVGEIGGSIAAFPVPASTIPKAIAAGAGFGATQFLEEGEGAGTFAGNVALDAVLGGVGQWAAPFIQKGFGKTKALFSGLYKKATGIDPRPSMFTGDGGLSDDGIRALDSLGMSEDEFSRIYTSLDQNLNPIQSARQSRAKEHGIDLSQGEISQDFATQEAEQTLRSGLGKESEAARALDVTKQAQLSGAQEKFVGSLGDVAEGRVASGGKVQEAARGIQTEGREKVSELYKAAKDTAGDEVPIDKFSLLDTVDEEISTRGVDDKIVNKIESLMGKYGLLEGEVTKAGRFNSVLQEDGTLVKFKGDQTPVTLDNAEDLRKGLNKLLPDDTSGTVRQIIGKLDSIVEGTIQQLPGGAPKAEAFKVARTAAREEFKKFSQKDILEKLVGFKKGTITDQLPPDVVMDRIYKGAEGVTNLKKIKRVLMNNPNNQSLDAWKSIQAQGVADLFADSINPATGDISGARLKSAIKRFGNGKTEEGIGKLKILLGDRYKEFDSLTKAIGDATIPLKGTTNPSGTAYKILNFMTRVGTVGQFGADALVTVAGKAKDAQKARKVLRGIETAAPEAVKQAVKVNNELIDAFMSLGISRTAQTE